MAPSYHVLRFHNLGFGRCHTDLGGAGSPRVDGAKTSLYKYDRVLSSFLDPSGDYVARNRVRDD